MKAGEWRAGGCIAGCAALLTMILIAGCGGETPSAETTTATVFTDTELPGTDTSETETTETTDSTKTTETTETTETDEPSATNRAEFGPTFGLTIVNFGAVALGGASSRTIELVNATGAEQTVRGLERSGEDASDFAIVGDDCLPGTQLAPGESCSVEVNFMPTARGARRATLRLSLDPDKVFSVVLRGTGGFVLPMPQETVTDPGAVTG